MLNWPTENKLLEPDQGVQGHVPGRGVSWEEGRGLLDTDLSVVGWLRDTHWGHSALKRATGFGGYIVHSYMEIINYSCLGVGRETFLGGYT